MPDPSYIKPEGGFLDYMMNCLPTTILILAARLQKSKTGVGMTSTKIAPSNEYSLVQYSSCSRVMLSWDKFHRFSYILWPLQVITTLVSGHNQANKKMSVGG